jgi:DNA polymerase-3 subunit alpha
MMQTYIIRCRFPERRREAPAVLLDIMPETHGVMVYQEDVIRVAHCFAGLSLAEADVLRRGMSGKFRSRDELEQVRSRFFEGCHARGHSPELSREVWRQIESFAGYAFAKGHAASYVVESYQSLYLKAHYPLEYMVATLRNGGGFYSTEHYLHEAVRLGAQVSAPCVQHSEGEIGLCGREIRLGLLMIRGINEDFVLRLLTERKQGGAFAGLPDFCRRLSPPREQLVLLVRIGAFRFTGLSRKALMWEAHLHTIEKGPVSSGTLFCRDLSPSPDLPQLEEADYESVFEEYELLGFPLSSPFSLLLGSPPAGVFSADLKAHRGRVVGVNAYLVSIKDTRTVKGDRMQFGTFVDQRGDYIDTVHFPPVVARYPFRGPGVYHLSGRVTEELGFYSLDVQRMELWPRIPDPRFADSPRHTGPADSCAAVPPVTCACASSEPRHPGLNGSGQPECTAADVGSEIHQPTIATT